MAGFEYGEKLVCLEMVKIGDKGFAPGSDFPYIELKVDAKLIDSLLSQRKVARAAYISPEILEELTIDRTAKVIKNFPDGRVVTSWPKYEPIPKGTIDGRPAHLRPDSSDEESTEDPGTGGDETGENADDPVSDDCNVQIVETQSKGWFDVIVDGIPVNTKKLREADAIKLKEEYL